MYCGTICGSGWLDVRCWLLEAGSRATTSLYRLESARRLSYFPLFLTFRSPHQHHPALQDLPFQSETEPHTHTQAPYRAPGLFRFACCGWPCTAAPVPCEDGAFFSFLKYLHTQFLITLTKSVGFLGGVVTVLGRSDVVTQSWMPILRFHFTPVEVAFLRSAPTPPSDAATSAVILKLCLFIYPPRWVWSIRSSAMRASSVAGLVLCASGHSFSFSASLLLKASS